MDDKGKEGLKGSPSRDSFKQKHKSLDPSFYACDLDFVLVDKKEGGRIVAFLDFKKPLDSITFSEVLAYEILKVIAPIYIVVSPAPDDGPFSVRQYISGNYRPYPPECNIQKICECLNWEQFAQWEKELRGR